MIDPPNNGLRRYGVVAASLHWAMAMLMAAQLGVGFAFHAMARGPVRSEWFAWHKTLGILVLVLAIVRLGWRLRHPPFPPMPPMPVWRRRAATIVHRAFYVVMIALPASGLIAVSGYADTDVIDLAGGMAVPQLPGIAYGVGESAEQFHKALVQAMIALTVLHVGAALSNRVIRP